MNVYLFSKINAFFSKIVAFYCGGLEKAALSVYSEALNREVELEIFILQEALSFQPLSLLLVNDGQDFEALHLENTLRQLQDQKTFNQVLIVGIKAGDRMQEYGTACQGDYANRGTKAALYSSFIVKELLPFLHRRFRITKASEQRAFAGFSLGGLSALDIVWNHPNVFHQVGVFSGSLWWRSTPFDPLHPDNDLIMHRQIAEGSKRSGLRFWFQTGTHDETSDRNNNGVIDAIDDTLSLIGELEKLGYKNGEDIAYLEVEKGEHNPDTWGLVMPDFLRWCFS